MYEDDIKAVMEWCNAEEHTFSYAHTDEDDGEDVIFVATNDYVEFADWLRENILDLICIRGKIGNDGVWFSKDDLEKAKFF